MTMPETSPVPVPPEPARPPYERYPDLPHYPWGQAPAHLATDWQLSQEGLTPTASPVAVISKRDASIELYDRADTRRRW